MVLRTAVVSMVCLVFAQVLSIELSASSLQNNGQFTNTDVIDLKKAGVGDEVIILRIRSGPASFKMDTGDIVALKSAGVSDAVIAEMLKTTAPAVVNSVNRTSELLDLSDGALIFAFTSAVNDPAAAGLPEVTRTAVINILKSSRTFAAVGTPEQAKDKTAKIEINAELVDFAAGSAAKRILIGVGTGRAHAGFSFTVKDVASGKILWKNTVKETASFWSNSASSSAQRAELPEKVAKSFVEQLTKAKIFAQPR